MTKNIIRIQGGWRADHYWGKSSPLQEYFHDDQFGGRAKAEAAAGRWLSRMAKEYPAPLEKGRKPIMGKIKDSYGIKGEGFYVVWTKRSEGRQRQKTFPISEHGSPERAERAAREFLAARMKEYEDGE
jgi:hypothetical protein